MMLGAIILKLLDTETFSRDSSELCYMCWALSFLGEVGGRGQRDILRSIATGLSF